MSTSEKALCSGELNERSSPSSFFPKGEMRLQYIMSHVRKSSFLSWRSIEYSLCAYVSDEFVTDSIQCQSLLGGGRIFLVCSDIVRMMER